MSDIEYQLRPLEEGPHLEQAREWAKKRRAFVHHTFDCVPGKKHIGVFVNLEMVSVISVIIDEYGHRLAITSPPRSDINTIASATYHVIWGLFDQCKAARVYVMVPKLKQRHWHRGDLRLCEMCGGIPTGYSEMDEYGHRWFEYELLRANWIKDHLKKAA